MVILRNTLAAGAALLAGFGAANAKLVQFELNGLSSSGETAATLSFVIDDEAPQTGATGAGNLIKLFDAGAGVQELTLTVEDVSASAMASINLSDIAFDSRSLGHTANPAPFDFNQTLRLVGLNASSQQIFSLLLSTELSDPEYNPFSSSLSELLEDFDPAGFVLGALSGSSTLSLNPSAAAAFSTFAAIIGMDSSAGSTSLSFTFTDVFATDDLSSAAVPIPGAALLFAPALAGFALRRRKSR
ncbi:MAG: hypothetical protein V2J51_09385 [Erythrobacter sp.]|jgi:hypothetical protein|nr:hypothetical protein [Erythrobacter sp.]